jgi:cystathionine gamma-synthase
MKLKTELHKETLAVHGQSGIDPLTKAINQPLYLSTTFERDKEDSSTFAYSRESHPNRHNLEATLAALEGGQRAFCFSSGLAAMSALLQSLKSGDHIILPKDIYFGAKHLVGDIWQRWNLNCTVVDLTQIENLQDAIQENTKLIWVETPSNPLLTIVDLSAVSKIAKQVGALSVCDNTLGTPMLQNPINFGIDVVMHSTTKSINGHSDVLGGALVFAKENEHSKRVATIQGSGGAVPSPFDCMMTLRGLQTLPLRVRQQCENAEFLCQYLKQHPAIEDVLYPGLASHPQHELAKSQMKSFGSVASLLIKGNEQQTRDVASALELIIEATSLGGTHTKIEHRHSIEGEGTQAPPNLLRVSFGIEHPMDLKADLEQALKRVIAC